MTNQCEGHTEKDLGALIEQAIPYSQHCLAKYDSVHRNLGSFCKYGQCWNNNFLLIYELKAYLQIFPHLHGKDVNVKANKPP